MVRATGTVPSVPPVPGLADTPYWTNREAVATTTLPGSLIVLGGGAIGLELGQVFARFGVTVTIVEAADRLLAQEEPEVSELIARTLQTEGITVRTGATIDRTSHDGRRFALRLVGAELLHAERLLVATSCSARPGRRLHGHSTGDLHRPRDRGSGVDRGAGARTRP